MKSQSLIIVLFSILQISCQNRSDYPSDSNAYHENYSQFESETSNQSRSNKDGIVNTMFGGGKKTHEFRDARTGIVTMTSEYPANWNVISKPAYTFDQKVPMFLTQVQGPHNLQAFNTPVYFNIDYPDPQIRQWMKTQGSYGHLVKPMMTKEQIMQKEVNNRMANSGFVLVGRKQVPRAENFIRKKMNENAIPDSGFEHYATEWTNNKGQKALVTLVTVNMQQPIPIFGGSMVLWFYSLDYIFVDDNHFESTINQFAEVTENSKETSQWKQYQNQLIQLRQQKAMRDAEIARRDRQVAFNMHQKKIQGMSAAQDANHASFMNRNFGSGSGVGQKQFINMINEQETVYNPSTGQNYQVNAGSTQYWMDSDRNYIENNNLFYNPNGDINLNHKEWTKVKKAF